MDRAFFLLYFMQIFWILLLVTKLEARIHLNNTKLTSSCDKDFISRIDRMHLTVWLDVDQDKTLKDQIDLKITTKAHENLQHICTVTTTDCKTPRCSCVYSAEEQRVFVTVNILLQSEYSEGFIIAKVCSSATNCQIVTITQLPIVYDPNSVLLQINSRNVSDNTTYIQLSADEKHLRFCCLNSPSPCNTKIIQDKKTMAQGTRSRCSSLKMKTGAINATYMVLYAICSGNFTTSRIHVVRNADTTDDSYILIIVLVLVGIGLSLLVFILLCCFCRKKTSKEPLSKKSTEDSSSSFIEDPVPVISLKNKAEKIIYNTSRPLRPNLKEKQIKNVNFRKITDQQEQVTFKEIPVHRTL